PGGPAPAADPLPARPWQGSACPRTHPRAGLPAIRGTRGLEDTERFRRGAHPHARSAAGPGGLVRRGLPGGELRTAEAVHPVHGHVQRHRAARGEPAALLGRGRSADRRHGGRADGRRGPAALALGPGRGRPAMEGPASRALVMTWSGGDPMQGRGRLAGRAIHGLIALCASAAVLALLAFGYGPVPALGRALDPGHGAWASAAGGLPVRSRTLTLPGLAHPVSVTFTSHGVPSIRAASQDDAFLALGYLHASFRLTEMDLERRLGEGRVAQLAGPSGLASDKFELRLGLLRTAQAEWAVMPRS